MKILNLIGSLNPADGGPVEALRGQTHIMSSLGHYPTIVTRDSPEKPWSNRFLCQVDSLGPTRFKYGYNPRLDTWLSKNCLDFDAIVVHGLWQYHGLSVRKAALRSGVPYFVMPHGSLDPWFGRKYPFKHIKKQMYWPWAEYRVLRDARGVFFSSEQEMLLARESFRPYKVREFMIGFAAAASSSTRESDRDVFFSAFPHLKGLRIVLFLGRLHPKKGCDLLIDAFSEIAPGNPDLHLVMAGPDQIGWKKSLEAQVRSRGIADRVSWIGMVEGGLKWGALQSAEIFVLPSHSENFGVAVAEALACGVPSLISDKVNIWRAVQDEGGGLVAPDSRQGCLSLLNEWLTMSLASQQTMRIRARTCFEKHFEINAFVENYMRIIQHLRSDLNATEC